MPREGVTAVTEPKSAQGWCNKIRVLPNIQVRWRDGEYRVSYKGLRPEREEAMAYYTDDGEDAYGTAGTMSRDWELTVFYDDMLPATRMAEMRRQSAHKPSNVAR
jgi:hypothetical protein